MDEVKASCHARGRCWSKPRVSLSRPARGCTTPSRADGLRPGRVNQRATAPGGHAQGNRRATFEGPRKRTRRWVAIRAHAGNPSLWAGQGHGPIVSRAYPVVKRRGIPRCATASSPTRGEKIRPVSVGRMPGTRPEFAGGAAVGCIEPPGFPAGRFGARVTRALPRSFRLPAGWRVTKVCVVGPCCPLRTLSVFAHE